jgi:hypothetical protein
MHASAAASTIALIVALSPVASACAAHRSDAAMPPQSTPTACTGETRLRITNDTRSNLEIVETIRTSEVVVGMVGPGAQTVITPADGATYGVRQVGSKNWVAVERSRPESPHVRFRRECA